MSAALIVALVGITVAFIVVVVLATRFAVRRIAANSVAAIEAEFTGRHVIRQAPMANYFGLKSKGGKQVRGNGALVLTDDELWFRRIGASEPLRIARLSITGATIVQSHAGKTVGRPLVRVDYEGPDGPDAAAWFVPDAEAWVALLSE